MSNLKEIETRINAIARTSSITQAMHNIAASKLKKTTDLLTNYNQFMKELDGVLKDVAVKTGTHRYIAGKPIENPKILYIVVTGDRGLAGGYHQQIFKYLETLQDKQEEPLNLLMIGKKGFYYAQRKKYNLLNSNFISNRDDLQTVYFGRYIEILKEEFIKENIDEVRIIYNHFINSAQYDVQEESLLPIKLDEKKLKEVHQMTFEYDNNPADVLESMITIYLQSRIFGLMVDGKLSELSARMLAMKSATDNAKEVVKELNIIYHRARQQKITTELIDIVNGSL